MAKPLVSVIIVNYNAGQFLARSVKSVSNFPGAEVIVIDNSPPNPNLGFSRAVNLGAEKCHGEYIFLLNPDTSVSKTALARMITTVRSYHNRAIIAPALVNPDGTPQASCYRPQTIGNAVKEYWFNIKGAYGKYLPAGKSLRRVHAAVAAAWLIPRAVWEELGGLSPRFFLYFEDLDMCDRAGHAGIPVIYDPRAKVIHTHGVSSRTNPIVLKLFTDSAWEYHGRLKKILIDLIIHARDLFVPPVSPKKTLGIILLYSLFVLGVTALGYFLLPMRYAPSSAIASFYHRNFLLWSWANFDGAHYLNIAVNGYQTILGQSEYAFFPLFPLLINLVSKTGLDLYLSAHLVSLLSSIGFIVVLLKWVSSYLKNPLTLLWLVLLSPGAIFLSAIYTEPLFLFLTVLTFYFADRGESGKAVLTTALATATRINGIFLVLFLLFKFRRSLLPILGLSGLFAYMTYLYFQTGSALAWYSAQSGWGKANPTAPWITLGNYFRALTFEFIPDLTHLVVLIEVIVTTIFIYLLIRFWRQTKLDSAYKYYALATLALPLSTGSLGSMPRFSLTLFPLFLMIPILPRTLRIVHWSLFIVMSIIGIILFTRGYWYA
ncbi:MAG: mannosyltransferase family protein [bacterium]